MIGERASNVPGDKSILLMRRIIKNGLFSARKGYSRRMKIRRFPHLATLSLLLSFSIPAQADWVTTTFEVYQGKPHQGMTGWETFEKFSLQTPLMRDVYIREIENYLFAVAKRYEKMGLPDPIAGGTLHSLVTNDKGEKAIRVYLYPDTSSWDVLDKVAWYKVHPCNGKGTRGQLFLNTVKFAHDFRLNDRDYSTLAHELFHASYWASPFSKTRGCISPEKWMSEGTADAIGHDMARVLRNAKFEDHRKPFGVRDYSHPLNKPNDKKPSQGYFTSSFWRHLAEMNHASKAGKSHAGSAPQKHDYDYLVSLFNQDYNFRPGSDGLITWLNQMLKEKTAIKVGLDGVLPQFMATFAHIIDTRVASSKKVPQKDRRERWLGYLFGDCPSAGQISQTTRTDIKLKVQPNAARCFKVEVQPGTTNPEVRIMLMHDNKALLKQLYIGLLDGTDVRPADVRSYVDDQPPYFATWTFPIFFGNRDVYILTNVGKYPAATREIEETFHIATGKWNSNMTTPPTPTPAPPSANTNTPATKVKEEKARYDDIIKSPVKNLAPVSKLDRKNYDKKAQCEPVLLRLNKCGPQLRITLELSPFAQIRSLVGTGQLGRFNAIVDVSDPNSEFATSPQYGIAVQEAQAALESMDASTIRMTLPKIDYGYQGTLSNVSIEVSKANSPNRGYISYGPSIQSGGQLIHRPPNGTVTIEEYSYLALQGTFEADLVDEADRGPDEAPTVARSISGRFFMPAPFEWDESFIIDKEHQKEQLIKSMLQQAPFKTPVMQGIIESMGGIPPQDLCDNGIDDSYLKAMGFTEGCEGRTAQMTACSCECELRKEEEKLPACERKCRKTWRDCPLPKDVASAGLDQQLDHCREAMIERGLPDAQIPVFLKMLRDAPELQRPGMIKQWCQ